MMAAEVGTEETGSISAGTGVSSGEGPDTAHFYYPKTRVRVSELGAVANQILRQPSDNSPDSLLEMPMYPLPGGDLCGSVLPVTGSGSGGGHSIAFGTSSAADAGGSVSPTSEGLNSGISPTSMGLDGPSYFPLLPPPPPPPPGYGTLGTVDENDMQDGPEYEEEEVTFPLTAPPTNQ